MKRANECRYFITEVAAIPLIRLYKKSDAYRQATKPGWGVVDTDKNGILYCDEDSGAVLIDCVGQEHFIAPYEDLDPKQWPKQAECIAIIQSDSCGFSFWENEPGRIKLYVTYDENGFVDTFRLATWTESTYGNEVDVLFKNLPMEASR